MLGEGSSEEGDGAERTCSASERISRTFLRERQSLSEHPDFLVKTQSRWIGIELTEYHVQEPDEGWGSPMRALEGTEDKVLRTASEQYQSKGLPPVVVNVLWHPHQALNRRRIQELAADLANLVEEYLPEIGHSVTIRRRRHHPAWRSLPQEVASLTVVRQKSISKNSWTSVRGAFVPIFTPPELQQIMEQRSQGALIPAAVSRSVVFYRCSRFRTVHAC